MYRQYFRVCKFPTNLRILENNRCGTSNNINKKHVYSLASHQLIPRGRPFQLGPTFSSLFRPTFLCHHTEKKHFSKKNLETEYVTVEKSDISPVAGSSPNIPTHFESQEDQSDASENKMMNQSDLFEDIDYDEITGGDEENLNKFKLLMLEIDVMRQDGMQVPSKMSTDEWKILFSLQSRNQRRKHLIFLFKTEMKKLSDKRKKELKRLAKDSTEEKEKVDSPSGHLQYGFRGSTIHIRVYDTTINFHDNCRLIRAMMFGQDLVIDCGFYNDMNSMENKLCCKQLVYLFAENRLSKEPFNLHFCNLKKDSFLYHQLKRSIPTIEDPAFPINIYDEHYLDLFPKEKLVYLTPHCRNELMEFNHDDVYIVGAIVDRVNTQPLTLAKAKSEGLRMAQLPLDRYLDWGLGNKSLTVNQVVSIMHDAQVTGDWNIALKHVPQRKVRRPDERTRDYRKQWRRGTTFQPPPRFIKTY